MKNIVIAGGGTAGWLSALFFKQSFPGSNVTVVESSEIGILGAGEGSTPHIVSFLRDQLNINLQDLFYHAGATIKNGIKFTNWNGDGDHYFHPFSDKHHIFSDLNSVYEILQDKNLDDLFYTPSISNINRVKVEYNTNLESNSPVVEDSFSIHFDARLLAKFLKDVGVRRGINVIDSIIVNVNKTYADYIESVSLSNSEVLEVDFLIDCTGFKRYFLGKIYNQEWVSYSDTIPNNRAIPFFIENKTADIPSYTEAIAMKYGWVWKIPVQGRFGCGYVFDKRMVTDEEIKKEIEECFGVNNFPTVFNFEAGTFRNTWVKNCLSLGLSTGFIEPLEATSIWMIINSIEEFKKCITGAILRDEHYIQLYNDTVYKMNDEILSFIYLHYMTKKDDTEYWKEFRNRNKAPEAYLNLEVASSKYYNTKLFASYFPNTFSPESIAVVAAGGRFFKKNILNDISATIDYIDPNSKKYYSSLKKIFNEKKDIINKICLDHYEYINFMKSSYERRNKNN